MISKELRDRHMRMCQKFMMLRLDSLFSDLPRGEFMPLQTIYAYSLRNPGTKGIYVPRTGISAQGIIARSLPNPSFAGDKRLHRTLRG